LVIICHNLFSTKEGKPMTLPVVQFYDAIKKEDPLLAADILAENGGLLPFLLIMIPYMEPNTTGDADKQSILDACIVDLKYILEDGITLAERSLVQNMLSIFQTYNTSDSGSSYRITQTSSNPPTVLNNVLNAYKHQQQQSSCRAQAPESHPTVHSASKLTVC